MPRKAKRRIAKKKAVRKVIHKPGPKPTQQGPTTGVDAAASRNEMLKTMLAKGLGGPSVVTQGMPQMDPKMAALVNSLSNRRADLNRDKSDAEYVRAEKENIYNEEKQLKRNEKSIKQRKQVMVERDRLEERKEDVRDLEETLEGLNDVGKTQQEIKEKEKEKRHLTKQVRKQQQEIASNPYKKRVDKLDGDIEDLRGQLDVQNQILQTKPFTQGIEAVKEKLIAKENVRLQLENAKKAASIARDTYQLELEAEAQQAATEQYKNDHGAADQEAMKELLNRKQEAERTKKQATEEYQRYIQVADSKRKLSYEVEDLQNENTRITELTNTLKTQVTSDDFKNQMEEQRKQLLLQQGLQKEQELRQHFFNYRRNKLYETQANVRKAKADTEDIEKENKILEDEYNSEQAKTARETAAKEEAKANVALRQKKTLAERRKEQNEANYDLLVAAQEAEIAETDGAKEQISEIAQTAVDAENTRKMAEARRSLTKAQLHVATQQQEMDLQQQLAEQGILGQPEAVANLAAQLQNTQPKQEDMERIQAINTYNAAKKQFDDYYAGGLEMKDQKRWFEDHVNIKDIANAPMDELIEKNKILEYLSNNIPNKSGYDTDRAFRIATNEYFMNPELYNMASGNDFMV